MRMHAASLEPSSVRLCSKKRFIFHCQPFKRCQWWNSVRKVSPSSRCRTAFQQCATAAPEVAEPSTSLLPTGGALHPVLTREQAEASGGGEPLYDTEEGQSRPDAGNETPAKQQEPPQPTSSSSSSAHVNGQHALGNGELFIGQRLHAGLTSRPPSASSHQDGSALASAGSLPSKELASGSAADDAPANGSVGKSGGPSRQRATPSAKSPLSPGEKAGSQNSPADSVRPNSAPAVNNDRKAASSGARSNGTQQEWHRPSSPQAAGQRSPSSPRAKTGQRAAAAPPSSAGSNENIGRLLSKHRTKAPDRPLHMQRLNGWHTKAAAEVRPPGFGRRLYEQIKACSGLKDLMALATTHRSALTLFHISAILHQLAVMQKASSARATSSSGDDEQRSLFVQRLLHLSERKLSMCSHAIGEAAGRAAPSSETARSQRGDSNSPLRQAADANRDAATQPAHQASAHAKTGSSSSNGVSAQNPSSSSHTSSNDNFVSRNGHVKHVLSSTARQDDELNTHGSHSSSNNGRTSAVLGNGTNEVGAALHDHNLTPTVSSRVANGRTAAVNESSSNNNSNRPPGTPLGLPHHSSSGNQAMVAHSPLNVDHVGVSNGQHPAGGFAEGTQSSQDAAGTTRSREPAGTSNGSNHHISSLNGACHAGSAAAADKGSSETGALRHDGTTPLDTPKAHHSHAASSTTAASSRNNGHSSQPRAAGSSTAQSAAASNSRHALQPSIMADLLWALAKLQTPPPASWTAALLRAATACDCLQRANPTNLGKLMLALGQLKLQLPGDFQGELMRAYSEKLPDMDAPQVGVIFFCEHGLG